MKNKPKALQKALDAVDQLPDDWFGNETASFDDLPSISSKKEITRTSVYINKDDLQYLKKVSKRTHVSVAQISGEIIASFIAKSRQRDGTND